MRRTLVALLAIGVLTLFWRYLADSGYIDPRILAQLVNAGQSWQNSAWTVPGVMLIYSLSLATMFPLTVLVITTALFFGPWWGFLYAGLGTLSASATSFWLGQFLGREAVNHLAGPRVHRLAGHFSKRGIATMAVINLLPLAPFTLTNMLAGAFRLHFPHYMLGSTIGILPGLAVVTFTGVQLRTVFAGGTGTVVEAGLLIGLSAAVLVGLGWAAGRWLSSRNGL